METLENLKNTYAQEQGYEDWADLYRRAGYYDETKFFKHEDAVIVLAQKAALEKAAENAECNLYLKSIYRTKRGNHWRKLKEGMEYDPTTNSVMAKINRLSITNPENLIR